MKTIVPPTVRAGSGVRRLPTQAVSREIRHRPVFRSTSDAQERERLIAAGFITPAR